MKTPIRSFRDLDAWNVAMELAVACYRLAKRLPSDERFELSAQVRSAAVSVPANVAEGHSTGSDGLFLRHVRIALGSVGELETCFELTTRTGLCHASDVGPVQKQLARTGQVLQGLARSIRARQLKKAAAVSAAFLVWLAVGS
jgi:four helix bundle protein